MKSTRIYFAVPGLYTTGQEFEVWGEALKYAHSKVLPVRDCPGHFTRSFVDVREADSTGDRPLIRYEVSHDGNITRLHVAGKEN